MVDTLTQADYTASASGLDVAFNSSGSSIDITGYDWNFGDSTHSNLPNPVHTYNHRDTFLVSLTVFNKSNCPYMVCHNVAIDIPTGVSDFSSENYCSIYPNPLSTGSWQLTVGNNLMGSRLEIYDAGGRLIQKCEIRSAKPEMEPDVARGVYLLRISTPKATIIRKLIRL